MASCLTKTNMDQTTLTARLKMISSTRTEAAAIIISTREIRRHRNGHRSKELLYLTVGVVCGSSSLLDAAVTVATVHQWTGSLCPHVSTSGGKFTSCNGLGSLRITLSSDPVHLRHCCWAPPPHCRCGFTHSLVTPDSLRRFQSYKSGDAGTTQPQCLHSKCLQWLMELHDAAIAWSFLDSRRSIHLLLS